MWLLMCIAFLTGCSSAPTQDPISDSATGEEVPLPALEIIGHLGGPCKALDVVGGTAYIGQGPRLIVLDVSDPTHPIEIGRSEVLPDQIVDLVVQDGFAYAASVLHGVQILSVEDPSNPTRVGAATIASRTEGVSVVGDTLYAANGYNGLSIITVADKASPVQIASLPLESSRAGAVAVSGDVAYLGMHGGGVQVVSVADPERPTEIGVFSIGSTVVDLAIYRNHLYVIDYSNGSQVVSISDPEQPVEVARLGVDFPTGIAFNGDLAYVTTRLGKVHVVSIENAEKPTTVSVLDNQSATWSPVVRDESLYVANSSRGLQILSVADPKSPSMLSTWDNAFYADTVDVSGEIACVGDSREGVTVVSVRNPAKPVILGIIELDELEALRLIDETAYVCAQQDLVLVDLSEPSRPVELGRVSLDDHPEFVDVRVGHAYIITAEGRLVVVSVEDPRSPEIIGMLRMDGPGAALDVQEDLAFVSAGGLHLISIENPADPMVLGSLPSDKETGTVVAAGEVVYLHNWFSLDAISVSNPEAPAILGQTDVRSSETGDLTDNLLAIGFSDGAVEVFDASDPTAVTSIARFFTVDRTGGVRIADGRIYAADRNGGLYILQLPPVSQE